MSEAREVAYVIERHIHSELHYWNGRPQWPGADEGTCWVKRHDDALRFARYEDAACMLTWHCGGIGCVAEHIWVKP